MTYAIAFKPSADKQFAKLPKPHQQRIFTAIEQPLKFREAANRSRELLEF